MMAKLFMKVMGTVFAFLGIVGFFLPGEGMIHHLLHLTAPHNIIHLLTGALFLGVSRNEAHSQLVAKVFGFMYLFVAILGLFMDNIFGLMMATPAIQVVHFAVSALALYVGFKKTSASTGQSQSM